MTLSEDRGDVQVSNLHHFFSAMLRWMDEDVLHVLRYRVELKRFDDVATKGRETSFQALESRTESVRYDLRSMATS